MIPKLRFKGYTEDWANKTLGDIGEVRMCKRIFNSETNQSGDIPFYKIGTFGKTADAFIERRLYETYREKYNFPKNGDILISASGTLGRRVRYNGEEAYFQDSNIVWIENNEELVTNEFLYFLYEIVRYDSEGGTIQRLYNSIIKRAKIGVPSIAEQNKITLLLNSIDKKINLLTKKNEALETYKIGLMKKIFSQELRFKREDGTDYPKWKKMKISEVAICKDNKRVPLNQSQRNFKKGNIPYYGANGIVDFIDEYIFEEDLVLLAEDGGFFFEFNSKPIAQLVRGKSWVNNHAHVLKAREGIILTDFLFYSLVHRDIRKWIIGGSRVKLNKSDLLNITFYLPTIEEQIKISSVLSAAFKSINTLDEAIYKVEELKKGLLQQMFV